jgi:hypothetical protein
MLTALTPPAQRRWIELKANMLVAGVLAQAQMPDSARRVLARAEAMSSEAIDPDGELGGYAALIHLFMGDREEAVDHLRQYFDRNRGLAEGWQWKEHWWWQDLRSHPEFRSLVGLPPQVDSTG